MQSQWTRLLLPLLCSCCAACFIGNTIGVWGGITVMPSFMGKFFPQSQLEEQASTAPSSPYCLYNNLVLSLTGSVIYLSSLLSAIAATPLANSTGRKGVMWVMGALVVAATVLGASSESLAQIFVARAVAGLAVGLGFQAPVMYVAEVAPSMLRGAALSIWGGVLLVGFATPVVWNWGLANQPNDWRWSIVLNGSPGLLMLLLLPFVPESPSWLISKGGDEAAAKALQRLRAPDADVSKEVADLRASIHHATHHTHQDTEKGEPQQHKQPSALATYILAFSPMYFPELFLSTSYQMLRMVAGLNFVANWTPNLLVIFGAAPDQALLLSIAVAGPMVLVTFATALFVDKTGRRPLLLVGSVLTAGCLAAIGAVMALSVPVSVTPGSTQQPGKQLPLLVALLSIYSVVAEASIGGLSITVPAELQPMPIRSAASSITVVTRNLTSFVIVLLALPLMCWLKYGIFFLLAGAVLVSAVLLFVMTPETKNVPLEQVSQLIEKHWLWSKMAAVRNRQPELMRQQSMLSDASIILEEVASRQASTLRLP